MRSRCEIDVERLPDLPLGSRPGTGHKSADKRGLAAMKKARLVFHSPSIPFDKIAFHVVPR